MTDKEKRAARFVSEALEPLGEAFTMSAMAAGEPGLPARFRWRGTEYEILRVIETWKTTSRCRNGSDEQYVRKHWYRILTSEGTEMEIYFERQARSARDRKKRWWLLSISGETKA